MANVKKVIAGLKCCKEAIDITDPICGKCPYEEYAADCVSLLAAEAFELLKAQEPVEPVFNAMVETDMSYWSCGACGAFIYGNSYLHMAKDSMPRYCGYCGRAVKWE